MHNEKAQQVVEEIFSHPDRFGGLVGYHFTKTIPEEKTAIVSLDVEEKHLSPSGAVHGGVLSTVIDFAMGAAIFGCLKPGQLCSTIEFKINYLAPVRLHEKITGVAQVLRLGRSHAVVEATLSVENKKIAIGLGTYNLYTPKATSTNQSTSS